MADPVIEQTSTTTTTASTEQSAAAVLAPPAPSPRLDDIVRAIIAIALVGQFVFIVCFAVVQHVQLQSDVFTVDVSLVTAAAGFYIGSSYGRAREQQKNA